MILASPFNRLTCCHHRYWTLLARVIFFSSFLLFFSNVSADSSGYKVKAAYLYQFTKFAQWPVGFFKHKDAPIRICVLGRNPFGEILNNFSTKKSQDRPITIEFLSSLEQASFCHLVFISQSEEKRLTQILKHLKHVPVLTVSDMDDFSRRGGMIGFVPKQRKVGIEINVQSSKIANIKLSSKLLKVAIVIHGKLALNRIGVNSL